MIEIKDYKKRNYYKVNYEIEIGLLNKLKETKNSHNCKYKELINFLLNYRFKKLEEEQNDTRTNKRI